ncbi:MAG TPA: P1 family peptidase [Actinomycetes bacterium]
MDGTGPANSITDVPGLRVGHAQRVGEGWLTGCTVVLAPGDGAVGGVDVRGGGPGTRETDLLDPRNLVERVQAVLLTGGSSFGLAAADGVMRRLAATGRGFPVGATVVPIVPAAVVYDLGRGGAEQAWPDAELGAAAHDTAVGAGGTDVAQGCVGAGTGTKVGGLKGGVGTASAVLPGGATLGALAVVNAAGSAVDLRTGELLGARHLLADEVPGLRPPDPGDLGPAVEAAARTGDPGRTLATTLVVLATDLSLTKAQCQKVAGIGHDGLARALDPVHTMVDGDTVFTLATGDRAAPDFAAFHGLLTAAGTCVTRAVVHAVLSATSVDTSAGRLRSYREAFPSAFPT